MKKYYIFIICCALLCMNLSADVDLTPIEPIGKTLIIKVITKNIMKPFNENNIQGATPTKTMCQEQKLSVSFLKKDAKGNTTITLKFLRFKIGMKSPAGTINFDTAHPEQDKSKIFSFMSNIIGKTITITRNSKRKIIKIDGYDDILAALPPNPMFRAMFNIAYIKRIVEDNNFLIMGLPNKRVKKGDSWKAKIVNKNPMGISENMVLTYKFEGVKKDFQLAKLTFRGNIGIKKVDNSQKNMPEITLNNGTIVGTSWFDIRKHIITETVTKNSFDIIVSLKDFTSKNTQNIKTHISSETTSIVERYGEK